jgi:membrane protease YdiL (CAAX protease family)
MRNLRTGLALIAFALVALLILRYVPGNFLSNIEYANATLSYVIAGLLFVLIVRFLRLSTLEYFRLPARNWKSAVGLTIVVIGIYLEINRDNVVTLDVKSTILGIGYLFSIGFGEELISRIFTFGVLKRYGTKIAVFGSSFLFGLMHLNLYVGQYWDPWLAYWHVMETFGYGVFICALLIVTRSVWVVIIYHAFSDWGVVFTKDIPTKPEAPAISYPFWDGITSPIFNMSTSIILGLFLLWINRGVRIPKWGQRLAFKFKLVH